MASLGEESAQTVSGAAFRFCKPDGSQRLQISYRQQSNLEKVNVAVAARPVGVEPTQLSVTSICDMTRPDTNTSVLASKNDFKHCRAPALQKKTLTTERQTSWT